MSNLQPYLVVAFAVALVGCGSARSPLMDSGLPADSGTPADGSCDVDALAQALTGDAGTDCGSFVARLSGKVMLDMGWSGGIDCALSAQDAGHPFRLRLTFGGADSDSISVFVRNAAGQSFELSDGSHLPIGSTSTVGQQDCASFSPTTYLGIPLADGGIRDLGCDSAGASATVCTYTFSL